MFNLVLRKTEKRRLVYSTSNGFRFVFLGIALLIFLTVLSASGGMPFQRANIFALTLCIVCVGAALFLERWIFDMQSNLFEKNSGLIFFYFRKKKSLDSLKKVVLGDSLSSIRSTGRRLNPIDRRNVVLYLQDRDDKVYKLDIVKGPGMGELRKTAVKLSDFCSGTSFISSN